MNDAEEDRESEDKEASGRTPSKVTELCVELRDVLRRTQGWGPVRLESLQVESGTILVLISESVSLRVQSG